MQQMQTNAHPQEVGSNPALAEPADSRDTSGTNIEPLKDDDHNALQIIESMEQGILVWSVDARCTMYNERIFDVLELSPGDLWVGMEREMFLEMSASRGEFDQQVVEQTERNFKRAVPFSFDRLLPSGRVVVSRGGAIDSPKRPRGRTIAKARSTNAFGAWRMVAKL